MASPGRWAAIPVSYQLDPRCCRCRSKQRCSARAAWLYAGEHCTDGLVPQSALPLLTMKLATDPAVLAEELIGAGLAKRRSEGFVLSDFLNWNPSARQVQKKSQKGRQAAIKRWAKVKEHQEVGDSEPPEGLDSDEPPELDSGTDYAPGNATGIPSGSANGNAHYETVRDETVRTEPLVANDSERLSSFEREKEDDHSSSLQEVVAALGSPSKARRNGDGPTPIGDFFDTHFHEDRSA